MSHDHLCVSFVPLFNHLVQQDQEKYTHLSNITMWKRRTDSCAEWRTSISDRGLRQYESVSIIC